MLRILVFAVAMSLFSIAAFADCPDNCNNGFDVCVRNCGARFGCLLTFSHGRIGYLPRRGASRNLTPRPLRLADQCGSSMYSCSGTCCYSTSRGYYCADANGDC
jgi:hypothetical protein